MKKSLINSVHAFIRNAFGTACAILLIPVALIIKIVTLPFGSSIGRTPPEVAKYLKDFIEESGDAGDFDDFTSIPIRNPRLDSIRVRAGRYNGPDGNVTLADLRALLAEAEAIVD